MRAKLKIWLTRAFLPIFFVFSVLAPSQAYAFVPEVVYITGAPVATGGVAVGTLVITAVALAALAIGTGVGYIAVDWATSGGDELLVIPTTQNNPIVAPNASPTVPTVYGKKCHGYGGTTGVGGDATSACHQHFLNTYPTLQCPNYSTATGNCWGRDTLSGTTGTYYSDHYCVSASCIGGFTYGQLTSSTPSDHVMTIYDNTAVVNCPAGYTNNGGTCALTNPREALADGKCDFGRSPASGYYQFADVDCAGGVPSQICNEATGVCTVLGKNENGLPRRLVVSPRSDGGSDVYVDDQLTVNGQSQIASGHVGISADGTVDSVFGSVNPGTVPTDGSSPVNDPTQTSQIQFPTDYARTGEAATAAQGVRTDIQAQTQADADYRNGEQQRFQDRLGVPPSAELIPNTQSPVSITAVTFSSAAGCPADIPFDMFGTTYGISYAPMCNVMSMMRPLFLAFGAIGAAMIFAGGLKS